MAYSKAGYKAQKKYDDAHYKYVGVKVPLDIFAVMQTSKDYQNNNQFLNMLIMEKLRNDGLIADITEK